MNSIKFRHSYALKLEFQNNVNSLHTLDLFLHVIHFSISFFSEATSKQKAFIKYKIYHDLIYKLKHSAVLFSNININNIKTKKIVGSLLVKIWAYYHILISHIQTDWENRIEGKKTLSINNAIISSCDMRGRGIIIAELIAVRIVRKKRWTYQGHLIYTLWQRLMRNQ